MRLIIFLLLLVSVNSGPGQPCKDNPVNCGLLDFAYNEEVDRQCYYNHYDSGHEPWSLTIDGKYKREECAGFPKFMFKCMPVWPDKNIVQYEREITEGNNRDVESVVKQSATVNSDIPDGAIDVKAAALAYYNRDICQIAWYPTAIWIAGLVVVLCLCCILTVCVYKKYEAGVEFDDMKKETAEIKEERLENRAPLYRHRKHRIF
tara:strand:+ start:39 stop:653 length:615 start_codon:yes stop_codon:yes gene_type:complete